MNLARPRAGSLALAATLAAALVAGTVGTVPAVGASAQDPRAELLARFAGRPGTGATADAAPLAPREAGPTGPAKEPQSAPRADGSTAPDAAGTAPAAPRALAAEPATDCLGLDLQLTQTLDHNHLTWTPVASGATLNVKRERLGGTRATIAVADESNTGYDDRTHNPLGFVAYWVDIVNQGVTTSCRTPDVDDLDEDGNLKWWSMSTPDGAGYPDLFFAGDNAVWEEDTYPESDTSDPAFPAWAATTSRPAFSPTGRLVASVEQLGGLLSITVRKASDGTLQWSVPSPAGTMLDEPSFSPDGQRIVVEGLALDGQGAPVDPTVSNGLYTVPVNTPTHPLTPVPQSAGLVTADWLDSPRALASTTIVAADVSPGGLLTLVNATTGARVTVPGTAGALDPMGRPDGSILFTTLSPTGATLEERLSNGTLHHIQSWAGSTARWPVTDPDSGDVLVYLEQPDPDDPTATVWSVSAVDPATGQTEVTRLGLQDGQDVGFNGFDLRTPTSPGTSDFGGSANGDLLARSSTGILYAYPLSASASSFFDARRQMGVGWGSMTQFLAVGDLNSDRRGDIVSVDTAGALWLYPGKGSFGLGARTKIGSGWATYTLYSTGDFNGDTRADLIARDSAGRLWLYPGTGRGGVSARAQIGSGWSAFSAIVGPGDWNYDGRPDLLARERSTGYLYLYPGRGSGGFGARTYLGRGWNGLTGFAAPEIYYGFNALFARTSAGVLLDYNSMGDGVLKGSAVFEAGRGFGPYTITG